MRRAALLATLALLAGCNPRADDGPVVVSAIGGAPRVVDPSRGPLDTPTRLMLAATAQGLVRFDAAGQVEPGIAERWTVIDRGTSYIFRLRDAEWDDGKPVTAADVVTILRRQIAGGSRNPLAPFLTAIDEIVEMTPEVIEIRLKRPRPDLLKLFAQPEMALFRTRPPGGSGPFRIAFQRARTVLLQPALDPERTAEDEVGAPAPAADVRLIGERAARGITRFAARSADLVAGGSFADWPLVLTTQIAPANRRFDPAAGLFGLAVVRRTGVLADAANRAAIARTIDRAGFVAAISGAWTATAQLLPEQLDSAAPPATPAWSQPAAAGARSPRAQIAAWHVANPEPIVLRIALPEGPGATILFGYVGAALLSIGIQPQRVALDQDADLRLIDAVAPYDSARWYIATACRPCGDEARTAVEAAREAATPELRARYIAAADAALADDVAFIPFAPPLRWSLVSLRLRAWTGNSRAWHPLNHVRNDPDKASKDTAMAEKTARMNRPPFGEIASSYTGTDPAAVRKRVEAMEHLLEGLIKIPGIDRKIGLDVLLDLVPVGGDAIGAVMGGWMVWEARNIGMSKTQMARMFGNVGIDFLLGLIPWIGAVPDFFFRSNTQNLKMIKRHLDMHHPKTAVIEHG